MYHMITKLHLFFRYVAAGLYPVEEISIGDFAYQKTLEALDALDDNRKGADMVCISLLFVGLSKAKII